MMITVTGSRAGATPAQLAFLRDVLRTGTRLIHGGAMGVDRQAHVLFPAPDQIDIWPSNLEQLMWANKQPRATVHRMLPPLVRNRLMVDEGEILYALPKSTHEEFAGSGTWAALRYAEKTGRIYMIIWPDGTCSVKSFAYQEPT